jgi:hypothetical protein
MRYSVANSATIVLSPSLGVSSLQPQHQDHEKGGQPGQDRA